jgi:hypothetical protein
VADIRWIWLDTERTGCGWRLYVVTEARNYMRAFCPTLMVELKLKPKELRSASRPAETVKPKRLARLIRSKAKDYKRLTLRFSQGAVDRALDTLDSA